MKSINKNWTDENGNHIGGQSIGDGFTIVWQRGPLNESGRNGAFLIEVLCGCIDWIRLLGPCNVISGVGFTIGFGGCNSAFEGRLKTLIEVLEACLSQVLYYESQIRFACEENAQAESFLRRCVWAMKKTRHLEEEWIYGTLVGVPTLRESVLENASSALKCLESRRDRRADSGTLGTHISDSKILSTNGGISS